MTIDQMIDRTIGKEGAYSNHPNDRGGPTMWGITEDVARADGYTGDMRLLPRERAVTIYRNKYAVRPGFTRVAEHSAIIAEKLFDAGVNMGPSVPALWFQMLLNGLNDGGKHYPDIVEDAAIGARTIDTFKRYLATRGSDAERVMLTGLQCLQGAKYVELARTRSANESFLYGWLRNRI